MKKQIAILVVLTLVLSPAFSVYAGNGNQSNKAKGKSVKTEYVQKEQPNLKKVFKQELNSQKKEIAQSKKIIEEQKSQLESQYETLLAAGDTAGAEALLSSIEGLNKQIDEQKALMKKIINERYMVTKSKYTNAELAQFENAAALIEQMYKDVSILGLGSITVKNNIIKLDAPAYIKGGRTIVPVRAITEELGANVAWDQTMKSVTISKDGIEIVLSINSTKVLVGGVEQQLDASAEITNGRTYVPLRFISEVFGLYVNWDADSGQVDIEEGTETGETPSTDAPTDTTEDGTATDTPSDTTEDGTTTDTPSDTTEDGTTTDTPSDTSEGVITTDTADTPVI